MDAVLTISTQIIPDDAKTATIFAMKLLKKTLLILLALSALLTAAITWYLATFDSREPSRLAYVEYCAGCHPRTELLE